MKKSSLHLPLLLLLFAVLATTVFSSSPARAGWFSSRKTLLTIDGDPYSETDYRSWWQNWREKESPVPETPDSYIDWLLMLRDAKQMQLSDNPEYRHKIEVFLKFRTLMLLKAEEIDSHLRKPDQARLRELYDEKYQPLYHLAIIELPSSEAAELVRKARKEGLEPAAAAAAAGLDTPPAWKQAMVRPLSVDGALREVFSNPRKPGELFDINFNNHILLVEVLGIQEGSDEDFTRLQKKLVKKLLRSQQAELNQALFRRLREKYRPLVHDDNLKALNLKSDAATRKKIILEIGELKIDGNRIIPYLAQEEKMNRKRRGDNRLSEEQIKQRIINNIITQTLIGKEALARHYEKKPPFKEVYDFYRRNRLVIAWKQTVLDPLVKISDSDLEKEYSRLAEHFRTPDLVDVAWVQTSDRKLAAQIQQELKEGRDFFKVMTPRFGRGIEMQKSPLSKLPPFLRKVVGDLAPGEISAPIRRNRDTVFVKLIRRYPGQPRPLNEVSAQLRKMLREKRYREKERELLNKLRSRSTIKVDENVWQRLRRELLQEAEKE